MGMTGPRRTEEQARPTWWVCARCAQEYHRRGPEPSEGQRPRLRVGACRVCQAIVRAAVQAKPGALAPDLLAAMERLGRHVMGGNGAALRR